MREKEREGKRRRGRESEEQLDGEVRRFAGVSDKVCRPHFADFPFSPLFCTNASLSLSLSLSLYPALHPPFYSLLLLVVE